MGTIFSGSGIARNSLKLIPVKISSPKVFRFGTFIYCDDIF